MKKKIQNQNRTGKGVSAGEAQNSVEENTGAETQEVDETTVKHLQMVVSSIEGRKVSREEILDLVAGMRQRSMVKGEVLPYPAEDPDDKPG